MKDKKRIFIYIIAAIYIGMILSLGAIFAIGSGEMAIFGQAYFISQLVSDKLPVYPIPNGDNPDEYFTPNINGNQQIEIINQKYENGDFYLSICSNNSNNGNTTFNIDFSFLNPTSYTWTNGIATIANYPVADGGIANNSFTFRNATVTPATISTNEVAIVTLNMQAQLGKEGTQGSAIVTISYNVSGTVYGTKIYFKYYARTAAGCSLT